MTDSVVGVVLLATVPPPQIANLLQSADVYQTEAESFHPSAMTEVIEMAMAFGGGQRKHGDRLAQRDRLAMSNARVTFVLCSPPESSP